jgi:hypothetical protein
VAWLVRYHGITPGDCEPYMNEQDRGCHERCLAPFREYNLHSKSPFARPRSRLEDYRPIIEKYLPPRIVF